VRWFVVTGELRLRCLHLYLSLKAPPTYLPNTLTTTAADETLTSAAAEDQVRRRPSFLFEGDLVTCHPLSLYLVYISCERTTQNSFVLSPKPIHVAIKQ
jgi:hypothetical protein